MIKQYIEDSEQSLDKMVLDISPAKSPTEEELREKIKFFLPIAFDLLKPSLKNWHRSQMEGLVKKVVETIEDYESIYEDKDLNIFERTVLGQVCEDLKTKLLEELK